VPGCLRTRSTAVSPRPCMGLRAVVVRWWGARRSRHGTTDAKRRVGGWATDPWLHAYACMHDCHQDVTREMGGGEREFVNKRQFTYQRGIPHLHPDRTKRTWPWPDMALLRRQRAPRRALLRTATSQRVAMGRQSQVPSHCLCGGGSCLCTLVSPCLVSIISKR
jgi:hypothetical protein